MTVADTSYQNDNGQLPLKTLVTERPQTQTILSFE